MPATKPASTPNKAKPAARTAKEDSGVPIIVRRTNSYVSPDNKSNTDAAPAKPPSAQPKPAPAVAAGAKPAAPQKPQPEAPLEEPKAENAAFRPPADKAQDDGTPAVEVPTVFDTDQYHLPIKPHTRGRLNSFVSWVILTAVLLGTATYVFYRLEVIDLSRFGF